MRAATPNALCPVVALASGALAACYTVPPAPADDVDATLADVDAVASVDAPQTSAPARALACGAEHACALVDGDAICWGLAAGANVRRQPWEIQVVGPTRVALDAPLASLAAGDEHGAGLLADGRAVVWGRAELGLGTNLAVRVEVRAAASRLVAGPRTVLTVDAAGRLFETGARMDGTTWDAPADATVGDDAAALQPEAGAMLGAGRWFACTASDHDVVCWGAGPDGQLGAGPDASGPGPVAVLLPADARPIHALALGPDRACVISGGGGALHCWGRLHGPTPARVEVGLDALGPLTSVALGPEHACALDVEGAVACWGGNAHGQLGDPGVVSSTTALPLALPEVTALCAGRAFTCARLSSGEVRCWGDASRGQTGGGTPGPTFEPTPRRVPLELAR